MEEIFGKFLEIPAATWIALALIVAFGVILALVTPKVKWNAKMLATGALCIAIGFVLSYIRLVHMPQGGSITPASMLPVMMFAYAYGFGPGILCGVAYGILQMFQDPYIVGWVQAALDYPLAFAAIALAALARRLPERWGWLVAIALGGLGRFACHVLSGVVFFAEYAEGTGLSPFVYSVSYNAFVFVDLVICAVVMAFPQVRGALKKMTAK